MLKGWLPDSIPPDIPEWDKTLCLILEDNKEKASKKLRIEKIRNAEKEGIEIISMEDI